MKNADGRPYFSVKWIEALATDAIKPGKTERYYWDAKQTGLGLRLTSKGDRFFFVEYSIKNAARQRRVSLGKYGVVTLSEAQDRARRFVSAGKDGRDLQAERADEQAARAKRLTLDEVAAKWIELHVAPKRSPRTLHDYKKILRLHLSPLFGSRLIEDISRSDVLGLHQRMSDKKKTADYAVIVGKAIVNFGLKNGFLEKGLSNPFQGVEQYGYVGRERYLSPDEVMRIGEALTELEASGAISVFAAAAIRLLVFTGARKAEILTLEWDWVDLEQSALLLPRSKTGKKRIELNAAALEVLRQLPRVKGNPYVIVGQKPKSPMVTLYVPWGHVRKRAKISNCRIHDLRHTFASFAAADGLSLLLIGKLLGHTVPRTTQRYAHLTEDALRRANAELGSRLSALMGKKTSDDR